MASIVLPEGIKLLSGPEANRFSVIPDAGEFMLATDTHRVFAGVGDSAPGGHLVGRPDDVVYISWPGHGVTLGPTGITSVVSDGATLTLAQASLTQRPSFHVVAVPDANTLGIIMSGIAFVANTSLDAGRLYFLDVLSANALIDSTTEPSYSVPVCEVLRKDGTDAWMRFIDWRAWERGTTTSASTYSDVILADNPVAYWKFTESALVTNNGVGATAFNSYGSVNLPVVHMQAGVPPAAQQHLPGDANYYLFDGLHHTSTYMFSLDDGSAVFPDAGAPPTFSFELWFYPLSDVLANLFIRYDGAASYPINIRTLVGQKIDVGQSHPANNIVSDADYVMNAWNHIVYTNSVENARRRLWVNGVMKEVAGAHTVTGLAVNETRFATRIHARAHHWASYTGLELSAAQINARIAAHAVSAT